MNILAKSISDELFNLEHRANDIILNHLFDDVENQGFTISHYINYDHAIVIIFVDDNTEGEIRVDRVRKIFDISATCNSITVMPISGDWDLILQYLQKLKSNDLTL